MPKDTFLNLPGEKQDRILVSAIKEFAEKGYKNASVQHIATNAGISKGSMYTYFESKKQLFIHIIDMLVNRKMKIISEILSNNSNCNFYEYMEQILISGMEYAFQYPDLYRLYQVIQQQIPLEIQKELYQSINFRGISENKKIIMNAIKNGEVRNDIEIEFLIFMVFSIFRDFGSYLVESNAWKCKKEYENHIKQFMSFIKSGLKSEEVSL